MAVLKPYGIDNVTGQEVIGGPGDTLITGGASTNIYNTDGALTAARTVTGAGFPLSIAGSGNITLTPINNSTVSSTITATTSGTPTTSITHIGQQCTLDTVTAGTRARLQVGAAKSRMFFQDFSPATFTTLDVTTNGVEIFFDAAKSLRINSSDGLAGQALLSQGPLLPPIWGSAAGVNIYTGNGSLTASRTVTLNNQVLLITDTQGTVSANQNFYQNTFNTDIADSASNYNVNAAIDILTKTASMSCSNNAGGGSFAKLIASATSSEMIFGPNAGQNKITVQASGVNFTLQSTKDIRVNGVSGVVGQALISAGTGVTPAWGTAGLISSTSFDAATLSTTALYTVPAGKTLVVTQVLIRNTTAGSVTTPASVSLGSNAGVNDVIANTLLTGLTAANKVWSTAMQGSYFVVAAAGVLSLKVNTAVTGGAQTDVAHVFGFLV